ncbi:hypothetical protein QMK17_20105 [Rhodococcus sp. G-MC3]|uniref:hypothetical protein n=1 Tax=Rhodococcus sp. G-MC3 TaxID=3046209 RepID=UPI0024BB032C|nr:hypothetical protein [Rhodococcus sp. G-MC3]MDJ0395628.1 hypothetical protein [Rhodococcus sp. G-MC3]
MGATSLAMTAGESVMLSFIDEWSQLPFAGPYIRGTQQLDADGGAWRYFGHGLRSWASRCDSASGSVVETR